MGATNCPETPRQKMIGMMYLFYTALLALNVSNEVLTAFVAVNESMETTTKNFEEKTVGLYNSLNKAYMAQPEKFQATWDNALEIQRRANELFKYVQDLKIEIMTSAQGGEHTEAIRAEGMKLSELEAAPQIMLPGQGRGGKGPILMQKVDDFRNFSLSFIKDTSSTTYHNVFHSLNTPKKVSSEKTETKEWYAALCEGMPMVGTITLLTKLQADIRNAEADMIAYLNAETTALDIRISRLNALVNAKSGYVIAGGTYSANIFIGAQDTSMRPTVWLTTQAPYYDSVLVDGFWDYKLKDGLKYDTLPLDDYGAGVYETTGGVGDYTYGGLIQYKSNIRTMWMPFTSSYKVGATSATVSPTELLVVYKGIENPVRVAAAGYALESLNVVAHGAQVKRGAKAGEYIIYNIQNGIQEVKVSVNADGKTIGTETFRIKNVPSPMILLGTIRTNSSVTLNELINTPLKAAPQPGFIYQNASYSVIGFSIEIPVPGGMPQTFTINGQKIADNNAAATAVRNSVRKGTIVQFSKIRVNTASGPATAEGISLVVL